MKKFYLIAFAALSVALAGCSKVEEPVNVNQNESKTTQITRAGEITGTTEIYNSATFVLNERECDEGPYAEVTWKFGKKDQTGKFVEITNGITVNDSPSIFEYRISVDKSFSGGGYVVRAMAKAAEGMSNYVYSFDVTVMTPAIFRAYKSIYGGCVYYVKEGDVVPQYCKDMGDKYAFRAFTSMQPGGLIPIYCNKLSDSGKDYNVYSKVQMDALSQVAFYLHSGPWRESIALYTLQEAIYNGMIVYYWRNAYFTKDRNEDSPAIRNRGVVGYGYAL